MRRRLAAMLAIACGATAAAPGVQRDPFARAVRAAAQPAPAAPKPRLRAVMFEPGHSLADIDGQVLAVGEWFGEYRVAAIAERSVTLVRGGAPLVLVLDRESAK